MSIDNLVFMSNKYDAISKAKRLRGYDSDETSIRHSHDATFTSRAASRDGNMKAKREVSQSLDDGLYLTRLPSITITNKITNKVLNAKEKRKKKRLFENLEGEFFKEDNDQNESLITTEGNNKQAIANVDDDMDNQMSSNTNNKDDKISQQDDVMYDVNGEVIGHLRYQHGVMSNLPNENMGFMVSRENTEATSSALFRIASYENGKGYCTCARTSGRSIVKCTECNGTTGHERWCSHVTHPLQSKCNSCGKLIRQMTSQGSFVGISENSKYSKSANKRQHTTQSGSQSKMSDKKKKVKVRVPGDVDSNDSGLERSDVESLLEDEGNTQKTPTSFLRDLDRKLAGGAFDFHTDVNVNNVNTKLQFADDDDDLGIEKDFNEEDVEGDDSPPEGAHITSTGLPIYKNGVREAYLKALAATFARKALKAPLYPNRFISRPFVSSYFGNNRPLELSSTSSKEVKKSKTLPPMKIIFGKVKVDDYFPGGKMNPRKAFKKKLKFKSHSSALLPSLEEERKDKSADMHSQSAGALAKPIVTEENDD